MFTSSTRIILVCLLLAVPFGCASKPWQKPDTIAETPSVNTVEGHPVLSMPIVIPGQSTRVIPLAVQSAKGLFESDDPFSRGGVSMSRSRYATSHVAMDSGSAERNYPESRLPWNSGAEVRWHNAIARDGEGREWLLLDQRGVIGRWNMFGTVDPTTARSQECRGMLLIAVVADTNKDGRLDSLDARAAIVTNADASNPRQISPPNAQVWSTFYDLASDTVYLEVVKDTSGDGQFGYDDNPVPYAWKRGSDGPATPVVSDAIIQRAMDLLK